MILADIAALWGNYVWPIFLLVFGFGLVVFVHELGHFLAAKAVGVRVDRFALGFGPRLFGIKRGETDYCIKLLPLGGYVKMLGQEDVNAMAEGGEAADDPRSFLNKPIWARMVIVSAGVVMNVIFAAILFVVVCLVGINFLAPVVGGTVKNFPAATAVTSLDAPASRPASAPVTAPAAPNAGNSEAHGLKPGDRILTINGKPIPSFDKIGLMAALADKDEIFHVTFERGGKVGSCDMSVKVGSEGRLVFGIMPPRDLALGEPEDDNLVTPFKPGDRVVAIGTRTIEHHWEIDPIERTLDGRNVEVTVRRGGQRTTVTVRPVPYLGTAHVLFHKTDYTVLRYAKAVRSDDEKTIAVTMRDGTSETLAAEDYTTGRKDLLDVLGLIPRLRVVSVLSGSRADDAGLKAGDIITRYADHPTPTFTQLQAINERFAGEGTQIKVLRDGKGLEAMRIVPKERHDRFQIGVVLGVDTEHTAVASVRPGSLAAKAGLRPGDVITGVGGRTVTTWNEIIIERSRHTQGPVTISYLRGDHRREATVDDLAEAAFGPKHYRFSLFAEKAVFELLNNARVKKSNPLAAMAWGAAQTWDMIVLNYATLRSMARGTVPASEVRGPVGIVGLGIEVGRRGIIRLTYFLAMISVCLAVFNFLPLPLVDGGLAVILIIEKIRGKPLSVRVMNIIQLSGLAIILSIFVAVTWNDISRMIGELW